MNPLRSLPRAATLSLALGLSLVARLIKSHHGRIWAEGTPGVGSTFYVELPAVSGEAILPSSPPSAG